MIVLRLFAGAAVAAAVLILAPTGSAVAEPLCGGVVNGKPQQSCGATYAKFEGAAVGECEPGEIFDIGTWKCWKCPDGYRRWDYNPIDTQRACARQRASSGELGRATFVRKLCPSGTFWDPINGGECWRCPDGMNRTWGHVAEWNACSAGVLGPVARAIFIGKAGCNEPAGEHWDPRNGGECWRCDNGWARTMMSVDGPEACEKSATHEFRPAQLMRELTCPLGQHFDFTDLTQADINRLGLKNVSPVKSGTCWSCPANTRRSEASVKDRYACTYKTIRWKSPVYNEPGLFGLDGAEQVAIEALQDRALLDAVFQSFAESAKRRQTDIRKEVWRQLATRPAQESPFLAAVVYHKLQAAAIEPRKETPAIKRLLAAYKDYLVKRRTFIAQDALNAYEAWLTADKYYRAQRGGLFTLFDYGTVPPDFNEIVRTGLFTTPAAGVGAAASAIAIFTNRAVMQAVFTGAAAREHIVARVGQLLQEGAQRVISSAGARSLNSLSLAGGPAIIVSIGAMVAAASIEQIIQIESARPKLEASLAAAKLTPDLSAMLQTQGGQAEIFGYWALAVSGSRPPSQQAAQQIARLANDALAIRYSDAGLIGHKRTSHCLGIQGQPVSGAAIVLAECIENVAPTWALGTDGSMVLKGTKLCIDVPGGNEVNNQRLQLYSCNGTRAQTWTPASGEGLRLAETDLCILPAGTQAGVPVVLGGCGTAQGGWAMGVKGKSQSTQVVTQSGNTTTITGTYTLGSNNFLIGPQAGNPRPTRLVGPNNLCLMPAGRKVARGTRVVLGPCAAQETAFLIDGANKDIRSGVNSQLCLDVPNANGSDGNQLQLWDCNNTHAQRWDRTAASEFRTQLNGKCVDVQGGRPVEGQPIQLWTCNGTAAQRWALP